MNILDLILLIPLLSLLLMSLSVIHLFGVKPSFGPFIGFCIIQVWVYIFSLFNLLFAGAVSMLVLSLGVFYYAIFIKKKASPRKLLKSLIDPGFLYFIIVTVLTFISFSTINESFRGSDEISHWALSYKITFLNNKLYPNSGFNLMSFAYPPLPQITWYYFSFLSPAYQEWFVKATALMGVYAGMSTIFGTIRSEKKGVKAAKIAAAVILAYCIPLIFKELGAYQFIYADSMLGAWTVGILSIYFSTREIDTKKLVFVCAGLFTVTLVKDFGLLFAGFAGGIVAFDLIAAWWHQRGSAAAYEKIPGLKYKRYYLVWVFILIAAILAARLSWSAYLRNDSAAASPLALALNLLLIFAGLAAVIAIVNIVISWWDQKGARLAYERLLGLKSREYYVNALLLATGCVLIFRIVYGLATGTGTAAFDLTTVLFNSSAPYNRIATVGDLRRYLETISKYNIGPGSLLMMLTLPCAFITAVAFHMPKGLERKRLLTAVAGLLIASAGFLTLLYVIYVNYFPSAQLAYFAAFPRYTSPLAIAALSLATVLVMNRGTVKSGTGSPERRFPYAAANRMIRAAVALVLVFITLFSSSAFTTSPFFSDIIELDAKRRTAEANQEGFKDLLNPDKDKIFVIAQNDLPGTKTHILSASVALDYYPIIVVNPGGPFSFDIPSHQDPAKTGNGDHYDVATYTVYGDPDKVRDFITQSGANCIIVYQTDELMVNTYGKLFSDGLKNIDKKNPHLYRIVEQDGKIVFKYIEVAK